MEHDSVLKDIDVECITASAEVFCLGRRVREGRRLADGRLFPLSRLRHPDQRVVKPTAAAVAVEQC